MEIIKQMSIFFQVSFLEVPQKEKDQSILLMLSFCMDFLQEVPQDLEVSNFVKIDAQEVRILILRIRQIKLCLVLFQ